MGWHLIFSLKKEHDYAFQVLQGTAAGFLNLSSVDIWTRQVFVGEGTCTLQGVSQHLRPLSTGCSSHLSLSCDNQKCAQTLLARYPPGNQFLVDNHWAGVNAGFPLSSGREILLTGLEWWRWTWDEQMGLQRPGDELSSTWGVQTHHDDPVLNPLSASLLQHSTCSEERVWSCVGDTHSWVAKG